MTGLSYVPCAWCQKPGFLYPHCQSRTCPWARCSQCGKLTRLHITEV